MTKTALALFSILLLFLISIIPDDFQKASGSYYQRTGVEICGIEICSNPMTLQEKIEMFLQDQDEDYFESGVYQQSLQSLRIGGQMKTQWSDYGEYLRQLESQFGQIPEPEIGIIILNATGQPEFQDTLMGLEGQYAMNSAQGAVLEFPIYAIDYVRQELVDDVNCGDSEQMIFSAIDNKLECSYTDSKGGSDTESVIIDIVHYPPEVGVVYANETGSSVFEAGLSRLQGEYSPIFELTENDLPIVAYDYVLGNFSRNFTCDNISGIFSSDGTKQLECSYTDIAEETTTESVDITISHPKPEIGIIILNATGQPEFQDTLMGLEGQYAMNSAQGAVLEFPIYAIDYVRQELVEVDCDIPSDNLFPIDSFTINCTYDDDAGLSDSESATFSVLEIPDPVIGMEIEEDFYLLNSINPELETEDPNGVLIELPKIQAFDYSLEILTTDGLSCDDLPQDNMFEIGRTKIDCTFTDSIGLRTSDSMVVMIELLEPEITEEPEDTQLWIFVPENTSIPATTEDGIYLTFETLGYDEVEGNVLVECDPSSGSLITVGEHVVTCTAFNSSGEFAQDFFVLTVEPPQGVLPGWIKTNAGFWADGRIDDKTFANGIQFFIEHGIIVVPPSDSSTPGQSSGIPDWVKNNAGWWATDQIPDSAFIDGLQYLISKGIIMIPASSNGNYYEDTSVFQQSIPQIRAEMVSDPILVYRSFIVSTASPEIRHTSPISLMINSNKVNFVDQSKIQNSISRIDDSKLATIPDIRKSISSIDLDLKIGITLREQLVDYQSIGDLRILDNFNYEIFDFNLNNIEKAPESIDLKSIESDSKLSKIIEEMQERVLEIKKTK